MADSASIALDIVGAEVIPGDGRETIHRARVEIEQGRIARLTPGGARRPAIPAFDLGGRWLLPGLIDCHIHIVLEGGPDQLGNYRQFGVPYFTLLAARNARRSLAAGITTVRDCGGMYGLEFELRQAIQNGLAAGPRLLLAGAIVTSTSPGVDEFVGMYRPADGADEVRKACREQLRRGADFIKVQATGSVSSATEDPGATQMTLDELRAAVETARMAGKPVASHALNDAGVRLSLQAGCRTIEHFTPVQAETLEMFMQTGAYSVPTFSAQRQIQAHGLAGGVPPHIVRKLGELVGAQREAFDRARAAGLRIAMGTDAGTNYNRHGENAQELVYMVEMGMSPLEAIAAATRNAAEACGVAGQVGTVTPGQIADLIVLEGDPLDDIRAVQRVGEVFQGGRRVNRAALAALDEPFAGD